MYSKQAPRRPIDRRPFDQQSDYRQSDYRQPAYRQPVRVPPNYSGHAITELPPERDMPLPEPGPTIPDNGHFGQGSTPTPRFDDLPRVSELGGGSPAHRPALLPPESAPSAEEASPSQEENDTCASISAAPVPRTPSLFDARHFPFGHGFGFEELLILGLILFLLWESPREDPCEGGNRTDHGDLDETLILLGILLLCG